MRGTSPMLVVLFVLSAVVFPAFHAAAEPEPASWTFENGLRAVFIPAPASPMTACVALVGVGSAAETPDTYGSAHLLEHLLFNGTSHMTQEELYAAFDMIGAYANATTGKDLTMFQVLAPREHQARAGELLAGMLFDSTLPASVFEKEKGIVLEEIRAGMSPAERVGIVADAALLAGTPYARETLATEQDITRIDRADVLAFYTRHYITSNVTLVVMGDGIPAEARAWIEPLFGQGRRPLHARQVPPKPHYPPDGVWSTAPAPDGQWRLVVRYPAPAPGTPDYPAAVMLAAALDRHVLTLPGLPPLPELSAHVSAARWFTHLVVSVPFHPAAPQESLIAWRRSLRQLADTIAPDLDLTPVRTHLGYEDASLRQRPHYYPFFRGTELLLQPTPEMVNLSEAVAQVTAGEVRAVAARIFGGPHAAVVLVPDGQTALVEVPPAEPTPPAPAPTAAAPTEDVQEQLPNGLQVQVRREPGLRVAAIHVLVEGRVAREPEGQAGVAELLHRCLLAGTTTRDEAAIERALTAMGANVKTHDSPRIPYDDYSLSPGYSYLRVEVLDTYVTDALVLLADVLQHAAYPDAVVAREREQLQRDATVARDSLRRRARRSLYATLFGEHVPAAHSPLGDPEHIAALTPEDLRAVHPRYFAPDALRITVISGLDTARVRSLVHTLFGGLPPSRVDAPTEPEDALPVRGQLGAVVEQEIDTPQAQLYVGQVVTVAPEDRAVATVATAYVSERIAQVLREERGWAYAVGAAIEWGAPTPVWTVYFAGPGEHLEAAEAVVREEVRRVQSTTLPPHEVRRTTNRLRGQQQMRRLSAINRAYYWAMEARRDADGDTVPADAEASGSVTPERVRAVARTLWQPDAWVRVRLRATPD